MSSAPPNRRYRFGIFEADSATGELRRRGLRVKLHAQPFQLLLLLVDRPGEIVTRDEICGELWPDGTFVDYEHGVNSALNRLREALGDKAQNPRFVETIARRGYRFLAPVERIGSATETSAAASPSIVESPAIGPPASLLSGVLATPADLPRSSYTTVQTLFVLLQLMYLGFYVGALANLSEINELFSPLPYATEAFTALIVIAALLIPVRIFLICAAVFRAPGMRSSYLRLWWVLLPLDLLWSLAPFLLLHHMSYGLALACMTPLVYSPFAQRSLILMGAGEAKPQS